MTTKENAPRWQAKRGDLKSTHTNLSRLKQRREIERKRKAVRRLKKISKKPPRFDPPIKCGLDRRGNSATRDVSHDNVKVARLLLKDFQKIGMGE